MKGHALLHSKDEMTQEQQNAFNEQQNKQMTKLE